MSYREGLTEPGKTKAWMIGACLIVLFLSIRPIWSGLAVPIWDADMLYISFFSLLSDFTRAGKLMLWAPWINGGTPMFVMPGAGTFSPLMLFFSFIFGPGLNGFIGYWMALWGIATLGMLFLARHLGAPGWVSVAAALGYSISGFITGHAQHMDFISGYALLPWLILALDRLVMKPSFARIGASGLVHGLVLTGAYPGISFVVSMIAAFWVVVRSLHLHGAGKSDFRVWRLLLICLVGHGVLALIMGCPPFIAFLHEARGYTPRFASLDKQTVLLSNPLTIPAMITMFSPYLASLSLFGSSAFIPTDVSSTSVYVGLLPLAILAFSIRENPRSRLRNVLLGGAVLFFLLACSSSNPLRSILYEVFQPSRYFRHSSIFRMGFVFLILVASIVSGNEATRYLTSENRKGDRSMTRILAVFAATVFFAYFYVIDDGTARPDELSWALLRDLLLVIGIFGTAALSSGRRISGNSAIVTLLIFLIVDAMSTLHFSKETMYSTHPIPAGVRAEIEASYRASLDLMQTSGLNRLEGNNRNDGLISKIPQLHAYVPLINPHYESLKENKILSNIAVTENRIWFASHARYLPLNQSAHDHYLADSQSTGEVSLVIHDASSHEEHLVAEGRDARTHLKKIELDSIGYLPERLMFSVDLPEDGWLLVTDRWSPSWIVSVDAASAEMNVGNFVWRSVFVPKGRHKIEFSYDLGWLWPYVIASLIAFCTGLLGVIIDLVRSRQPNVKLDSRTIKPLSLASTP